MSWKIYIPSGTPWSGAIQNSSLFWMAFNPIRSAVQYSGPFGFGLWITVQNVGVLKCPGLYLPYYSEHAHIFLRGFVITKSNRPPCRLLPLEPDSHILSGRIVICTIWKDKKLKAKALLRESRLLAHTAGRELKTLNKKLLMPI